MATLAPSPSGGALTYVAANGGGDKYLNGGAEQLHFKNGSGAPIVVTVNSQKLCDQGFDHDVTFSIPAGGEKLLPRLSPLRYNDGTGFVLLTYDGVTSLTVGLIAP